MKAKVVVARGRSRGSWYALFLLMFCHCLSFVLLGSLSFVALVSFYVVRDRTKLLQYAVSRTNDWSARQELTPVCYPAACFTDHEPMVAVCHF